MPKDSNLLLELLAAYLAANSVGVLGEDLWIQALPVESENGVVVVHTGGVSFPDDPTRRPAFQVVVRNVNAEAGLAKAVEINNLLDNKWNVLPKWPGRITATAEPGTYFKDDAGRVNYPLNYVIVTTTQR